MNTLARRLLLLFALAATGLSLASCSADPNSQSESSDEDETADAQAPDLEMGMALPDAATDPPDTDLSSIPDSVSEDLAEDGIEDSSADRLEDESGDMARQQDLHADPDRQFNDVQIDIVEGIGPEGGTITIPGASLSIPPGALTETVDIQLTRVEESGVSGFIAYSALWHLEPHGLEFEIPATLSVHHEGNPEYAMGFVARNRLPGTDFERIPAEIEATAATVRVRRLADVIIGTWCEEQGCVPSSEYPIWIEATWISPNDPTPHNTSSEDGADLDVHLVASLSACWGESPHDCSEAACEGSGWCCAPDEGGLVPLVRSDRDGWGPEIVAVSQSALDSVGTSEFRLGVLSPVAQPHGDDPGPSDVSIQVYFDGVLTLDRRFGPLPYQAFWDVAELDAEAGTFTLINESHNTGVEGLCTD